MRKHVWFVLALLVAAPLPAAPQTEIIGSYYKTPEQKAMECYSRGMRAMRKAEKERDPEKQAKLYLKAKEELSKSVGFEGHYDGYLALGQVYLALGQKESALDACTFAQARKPKAEAAASCIDEAKRKIQEAAAAKKADEG